MTCPRCNGIAVRERDEHGEHIWCFACGTVDLAAPLPYVDGAERLDEAPRGRRRPPSRGGMRL